MQYTAVLRDLATACEFADYQDDMLRDQVAENIADCYILLTAVSAVTTINRIFCMTHLVHAIELFIIHSQRLWNKSKFYWPEEAQQSLAEVEQVFTCLLKHLTQSYSCLLTHLITNWVLSSQKYMLMVLSLSHPERLLQPYKNTPLMKKRLWHVFQQTKGGGHTYEIAELRCRLTIKH